MGMYVISAFKKTCNTNRVYADPLKRFQWNHVLKDPPTGPQSGSQIDTFCLLTHGIPYSGLFSWGANFGYFRD